MKRFFMLAEKNRIDKKFGLTKREAVARFFSDKQMKPISDRRPSEYEAKPGTIYRPRPGSSMGKVRVVQRGAVKTEKAIREAMKQLFTMFEDANGIKTICYSNNSGPTYGCAGDTGLESLLLEVINSPSSVSTYYLYGGSDQSDYLGCYGCANTASDSVCNSVGTYGSNVSSSSIWNTVGSYGSTVGTYSPWNSVSTSPPEFFNQDKTTTYGKFTVNTATANRTTVTKLTNIIDYFNNNSSDIAATREYACEQTQSASPINSLSSDKPNLNLSNKVIFD